MLARLGKKGRRVFVVMAGLAVAGGVGYWMDRPRVGEVVEVTCYWRDDDYGLYRTGVTQDAAAIGRITGEMRKGLWVLPTLRKTRNSFVLVLRDKKGLEEMWGVNADAYLFKWGGGREYWVSPAMREALMAATPPGEFQSPLGHKPYSAKEIQEAEERAARRAAFKRSSGE